MASRHHERAVKGRDSGSSALRLPQFRQANIVITSPVFKSTARSNNIAPWHLSQVFIPSPSHLSRGRPIGRSPSFDVQRALGVFLICTFSPQRRFARRFVHLLPIEFPEWIYCSGAVTIRAAGYLTRGAAPLFPTVVTLPDVNIAESGCRSADLCNHRGAHVIGYALIFLVDPPCRPSSSPSQRFVPL